MCVSTCSLVRPLFWSCDPRQSWFECSLDPSFQGGVRVLQCRHCLTLCTPRSGWCTVPVYVCLALNSVPCCTRVPVSCGILLIDLCRASLHRSNLRKRSGVPLRLAVLALPGCRCLCIGSQCGVAGKAAARQERCRTGSRQDMRMIQYSSIIVC